MSDATILTDMYPGKENEIWTPCIYEFFCQNKPQLQLPISSCIESPAPQGPWYQSRKPSSYLKIDGDIIEHPVTDEFLTKIGKNHELNLIEDPDRYLKGNDIAGITPDIILIKPEKKGVFIIENKPYGSGPSSFYGNQGPGGAYIEFVLWLNRKKIPCEYIVICPIGWTPREYQKEIEIQNQMQRFFGIIFLEDIFEQMSKYKFSYPVIKEQWKDYTEKGADYDYT
jgi:hypothetical protein